MTRLAERVNTIELTQQIKLVNSNKEWQVSKQHAT